MTERLRFRMRQGTAGPWLLAGGRTAVPGACGKLWTSVGALKNALRCMGDLRWNPPRCPDVTVYEYRETDDGQLVLVQRYAALHLGMQWGAGS